MLARLSRTPAGLLSAFLIAIAVFAGSTVYNQYVASRIDAAAHSISDNSASSIRALANARHEARQLESLVTQYVRRPSAALRAKVVAKQEDVDRAYQAYLQFDRYPGEGELWGEVERTARVFDRAVAHAMARADVGGNAEAEALVAAVAAAATQAADATSRAIDFNAQAGQELAHQITAQRRSGMKLAVVLDVASAMITLALGWFVIAAIRRHQNELAAERAQARRRADELEQFAGRLAHDIRGPMAAVGLVLSAVDRRIPDDEATVKLMARAHHALKRADAIMVGLFAFARAGAKPGPNDQTDLAALLDDVVIGLRPLAEADEIALRLEPPPARMVVGNRGVLTSVLENLIRNAIRYMTGSERRIEVRAMEKGRMVRVEIEDTGPGVPPELTHAIFEPHVRGHVDQKGIGLGLATVRKIVEAHGGSVGVHSIVGRGATFWFELPVAGAPAHAVVALH